jgi:hypothetical protein
LTLGARPTTRFRGQTDFAIPSRSRRAPPAPPSGPMANAGMTTAAPKAIRICGPMAIAILNRNRVVLPVRPCRQTGSAATAMAARTATHTYGVTDCATRRQRRQPARQARPRTALAIAFIPTAAQRGIRTTGATGSVTWSRSRITAATPVLHRQRMLRAFVVRRRTRTTGQTTSATRSRRWRGPTAVRRPVGCSVLAPVHTGA